MNNSTDEMSTSAIKAFVAAQSEMTAAAKDANNPQFKSKYATLKSVQDACFPALHKNGFGVMQPIVREGEQDYVETRIIHESGEIFTNRIPLLVKKTDMQGYGDAITYARRYGLGALAGIAPEDNDGNLAAKDAPAPKPRQNGKSQTAVNSDFQAFCTALDAIVEPDHIDVLKDKHEDTLKRLRAENGVAWNGGPDMPSVEQRFKAAREAANFVAQIKAMFSDAESQDGLHVCYADNKAQILALNNIRKTAVETALTVRDHELSGGVDTPFDKESAA